MSADPIDVTFHPDFSTPGRRLNKLDATVAPGVGDDADDRYEVRSVWVDVTADKSYVCVDSTAGAAVWQQFSGTGTGVTDHGALTGLGDDDHGAVYALLAHSTRHESGGADAIKLDDFATPDDNTDLDASLTEHGLMLKLGGGVADFLRADGTWATPAGTSGGRRVVMRPGITSPPEPVSNPDGDGWVYMEV